MVGCYTGAGPPACSLTLTCDPWQVAATHPGSTQCLTGRSHFGHQGTAVSQEEKAQEGSPGFRRAQPLGSLSSPHPQPR